MTARARTILILVLGLAVTGMVLLLLQQAGQSSPGKTASVPNASNGTATLTVMIKPSLIANTVTPAPTLSKLTTPTPITTRGTDDVPMVQVPAGKFIMGSSGEEIAHWEQMVRSAASAYPDIARDEWPQMTVNLDTFEIDQYEVTQAKYQRCVAAGACPPPYFWWNQGGSHNYENASSYDGTAADLPVYVLQPGATAYCQWVGKRLPTEAEWEKAARGTDGRTYPWGNEWDTSKLQAGYVPALIGSYPAGASPYGALDMAGNAPEWVGNQYRVYPGGQYTETAYFIDSKLGFVRRGGYYGNITTDSPPEAVYRVANRFIGDDSTASGFRCLQGPAPLPLEKAVASTMAITQPLPITNVDLSKMVEIPMGEFQMGRDSDPVLLLHAVYLDQFYIDRFETTNEEYVDFLNALGHTYSACEGITCVELRPKDIDRYDYPSRILEVNGQFLVETGFELYPVVSVSWEGADAYCRWQGKRLPTEAEWEKAARGTSNRKYPWGNEWNSGKYATKISPVGIYLEDVSPYGVRDVAGNAREWVSDWYDPNYYRFSPYRNPQGPEKPVKLGERITRPGLDGDLFTRKPTSHDYVTHNGVRCAYTP